jgi:hypothetical protein
MDSDDTTPGSSPIDEDDIPVPCKGCGSVSSNIGSDLFEIKLTRILQVLEEGKAFELGSIFYAILNSHHR